MLTLDKFEEASEKVKEVTLETKLVYSDFLSEQTGNKVYLKPENMQFIVITHRRGTMAAADRLYGITMQEKGVSTLVSVNLIENDLDK